MIIWWLNKFHHTWNAKYKIHFFLCLSLLWKKLRSLHDKIVEMFTLFSCFSPFVFCPFPLVYANIKMLECKCGYVPVRTSWLMPSTLTMALAMPFPSMSLTTPLIPRWTWERERFTNQWIISYNSLHLKHLNDPKWISCNIYESCWMVFSEVKTTHFTAQMIQLSPGALKDSVMDEWQTNDSSEVNNLKESDKIWQALALMQ